MTDFDDELRRHLSREADHVQGVPRGLAERVAAASGPRSALWLRVAPVAVLVLFVGGLGTVTLLPRVVQPVRGTGPVAVASSSPAGVISSAGPASPAPAGTASPQVAVAPPTVLAGADCSNGSSGGTAAATGNLTGLRVAHQDGFDRVVFEFAGTGIPRFTVTRQAGTRFTMDASGMPVDLQGTSGIKVVFHGASERDVNQNPTYSGSNDVVLAPAAGAGKGIAEVRQVGDFERVLSWGMGISAQPVCTRVLQLSSPSRLVLDVQQQP
jgi:hypothetical protein